MESQERVRSVTGQFRAKAALKILAPSRCREFPLYRLFHNIDPVPPVLKIVPPLRLCVFSRREGRQGRNADPVDEAPFKVIDTFMGVQVCNRPKLNSPISDEPGLVIKNMAFGI